MSKYFEVRWHGRGGQGTVTGAKSLAEAVQGTGKCVSAFPDYGPERRGAPVRAFDRFSDSRIRIHTPILAPDVVMIVDTTLIGDKSIVEGVSESTIFVVNTEKNAAETKSLLNLTTKTVYTVPANGMSDKYRLKDWLFTQGRFRHLKNPKWAYLIDEFQSRIDVQWDWLLTQEKRA